MYISDKLRVKIFEMLVNFFLFFYTKKDYLFIHLLKLGLRLYGSRATDRETKSSFKDEIELFFFYCNIKKYTCL